MELYQIIDAVRAESKTTVKLQILQANSGNEALKQYFYHAMNPMINYWIRSGDLPDKTGDQHLTADTITHIGNQLGNRVITGNTARVFLYNIMLTLTRPDQILLKNMINRDPDCKVGDKTINKVWKNLIPEFPVMLCAEYNAKNVVNIPEGKDAIIAQKKEDGGRVCIIVKPDGSVDVRSRNGNPVETCGIFDSQFSRFPGWVFDGELLSVDQTTGKFADRKTSNGIFTKAVRGTISYDEAKTLHIVMWDVIDYSAWQSGFDSTTYIERFKRLLRYSNDIQVHIGSVVDTQTFSTHAEVAKFYDKMIQQGFEGAIVKVATAPWENRRSVYSLKMKQTSDTTLKCIGVNPHSKKPGRIGSLNCVSEDGFVEVSVGSGLTEADTLQPPEYFIGKQIDVLFNMLITDKNTGKHSLFLPRYKCVRADKTTADTLEYIKGL